MDVNTLIQREILNWLKALLNTAGCNAPCCIKCFFCALKEQLNNMIQTTVLLGYFSECTPTKNPEPTKICQFGTFNI